jgi:hypothetical protein
MRICCCQGNIDGALLLLPQPRGPPSRRAAPAGYDPLSWGDYRWLPGTSDLLPFSGQVCNDCLVSRRNFTAQELDRAFTRFEYTAFRLERRESYAGTSYDSSRFARWQQGLLPELDPDVPWKQRVRSATAEGRRFARVRIVSEPWSDYTRYALWQARQNIAAGEDIRYLSRQRAEETCLPAELWEHDYWLFDSSLLVVMHYDDATDGLLRCELLDDPAVIVQHNYWRDAAWRHALPRDDYVRLVGGPVKPISGS